MEQPSPVQEYNAQLVGSLIELWCRQLKKRRLRPGSLGSSPVAVLLQAHNDLSWNAEKDILTEWAGQPLDDAYTWWSTIFEHGVAHRQQREPKGIHATAKGILQSLPWPLWVLYEVDETFDNALPRGNQDDDFTEVMFEPEQTAHRLLHVLYLLWQCYPFAKTDYEKFEARLVVAAQ